MPTTRHSLAQVVGAALWVGVKATAAGVSGASISISSTIGVSPPLAQNIDVSITKTATGTHTLTINPFKGPLGAVVHSITAETNGTALGVSTITAYTNDSLALTVKLFITSTGVLQDGDFNASIWAW